MLLISALTAAPDFPLPRVENGRGLSLAVTCERESHLYALGDSARFAVEIERLPGEATLRYRFTLEKARLVAEGSLAVTAGRTHLAGALDEPGFLRLDLTLTAGPDTLRAAQSAGFSPEAIRPTGALPSDYLRFWKQGRAELLRIPADPELTIQPGADSSGMRRYLVSLANVEGSRIYGWLTVPSGEGPFPAVVNLPGAPGGIHEFATGALAEYGRAGMIVLSLNIHGTLLGREDEYYRQLQSQGFPGSFPALGIDDPYRYYYRRVVLGGVRAIDYLVSRSDVDTTRIGLAGASQGGGLSLILASVDKRVKALSLHVPAMCDLTGVFHGRPTGWPHSLERHASLPAQRTVSYYDGALAAGLIEIPAIVGVSLLDEACPPTTVWAAYNSLAGPKRIEVYPGTTHPGSFTQARDRQMVDWMARQLGAKGSN